MYNKLMLTVAFVVLLGAGSLALAERLDLKVDIGALDARDPNNVITQPIKAGWTEWTEPRDDPGPPSVTKSFGDITVTLTQSGGNGLAFRNGTGGDLTGDMVAIDNQTEFSVITMTISGLEAGNYVMTTWHNYIFDDMAGVLDVKVDGVRKVRDLAVSLNAATDDAAASATFEFTASGADVVIEFISTKVSANVPLNGFHIERARPSVGFATASAGGLESISPAVLRVILSEAQEQVVTADYAVTGGTATGGGVDYKLAGFCVCDLDSSGDVGFPDLARFVDNWLSQTPDNIADINGDNNVNFEDFAVCGLEWFDACGGNTLQFNPGEIVKTIRIDIVNDGVTEEDETIVVELSNPTGPDVVLGTAQHTYTISDALPEVSFAADSSSGLENDTPAVIEVSLSHAGDKTITVDYTVTGGTATGGGVDYNLADGSLQFQPGVTSQSIQVQISDDEIKEIDETIIVTLSNPVNATLGATQQQTFSIIDDETGVLFDGLTWFHSDHLLRLSVNESGQLEWNTEKSDQLTVRLPEQRFSEVGDVVTFSYVWSSSGRVEQGCECYEDRNPDPDIYEYCSDVTCVGGTGDFRLGLFDSNGRGYITAPMTGPKDPVFQGYLGCHFRFFPHVPQDAPARFTEHKDDGGTESHTNTSIWERNNPEGNTALLSNSNSWNRLEEPMKGGLGLPIGGSALLTVRLERVSDDEAKLSLSCNGKTWTKYSETADVMPNKIDVFAIYLNSREYDYVTLAIPEAPRSSWPNPGDGGEDVPMNTSLNWRAGTLAVSHDIYFGTDESTVASATRASSEYKGNQTANSYVPGQLELGGTYYWRVDDVTETETLKGEVWSFTTVPCQAFEDFESYTDTLALLAAWYEGGGGYIDLSTEQQHEGAKSVELEYYNMFGITYSDCGYTFADAQDWASGDATALGLYFRGTASNGADKMYVIVEDAGGATATVTYGGSTNDLKNEKWQLWKIGFDQLGGVDISAVKKLVIGVGDRSGGSSGASGFLYLDDIGLCAGD